MNCTIPRDIVDPTAAGLTIGNGRAPDLLAAALEYHPRGWSIIPMRIGANKKPACKWKPYQTRRANESTLRQWFGNGSTFGIAVVFGGISDGLANRDFDDMAAYDLWALEYPDLAATLPTVATGRPGGGRHVYCRATARSLARIRARLAKPGTGAIALGDGELRAGVGCYAVLPPSPHPSGCRYQWLIPLGDDLPTIDLDAAGFARCYREGHFDAGNERKLASLTLPEHLGGIQEKHEIQEGKNNEGIQETPQTHPPQMSSVPLCSTLQRG